MLGQHQTHKVSRQVDLGSSPESRTESIKRYFLKSFVWRKQSGHKKSIRGRLVSKMMALSD
jgi:hypothetical protein